MHQSISGPWIADRVEYWCIPGFLSARECDRTVDSLCVAQARARSSGDNSQDLGSEEWLTEVDARLCRLLGFAPGAGGPLQYVAPTEPIAADAGAAYSSGRCFVSIYLNEGESAGEVSLGGGCTLRPPRGAALIAKRANPTISRPRPRQSREGVLTKNFPEPPVVDAKPMLLAVHRTRIPDQLFRTLRAIHEEQAAQAIDEHVPGYIECDLPVGSQLLQLSELLQREAHTALQPIAEKWSRRALEPTYVYGIRRYLRGATLKMHRDRPGTHTYGISLNIAECAEQPWPLVIEEEGGVCRNIVLQSGEMVLYESERMLHGRPHPLLGDFYAAVFAHFRPRPELRDP